MLLFFFSNGFLEACVTCSHPRRDEPWELAPVPAKIEKPWIHYRTGTQMSGVAEGGCPSSGRQWISHYLSFLPGAVINTPAKTALRKSLFQLVVPGVSPLLQEP